MVNPGSQPRSSLLQRVNLLIHFQSGPQIIWPNPAGVDSGPKSEVEQGFLPGGINHFAKLLRASLHLDLTAGLIPLFLSNLTLDVAVGQKYTD